MHLKWTHTQSKVKRCSKNHEEGVPIKYNRQSCYDQRERLPRYLSALVTEKMGERKIETKEGHRFASSPRNWWPRMSIIGSRSLRV